MVGKPEVLVQRLANDILRDIVEKIKAFPHRDVTIGPYKDWVRLYITSVRRFSALLQEEAVTRGHPYPHQKHHASLSSPSPLMPWCEKGLLHVRRELDDALLSSIFASKWNEVHLPRPLTLDSETTNAHASESSSHDPGEVKENGGEWKRSFCASSSSANPLPRTGWWNHSNVYTWKRLPPSRIEIFTPEFLTEPLMGGRVLSLYWNGLKSLRRCQVTSTSDPSHGSPSSVEETREATLLPVFLIPFSTLWALKAEAFGHVTRPTSVTASANRSSLPATTALSFQERQVRQRVLHTLQYAWELLAAPSPPFRWDADCGISFPRLGMLLPSEELDAICHVPTLRRRLVPPSSFVGSAKTFASPSGNRSTPPVHWTMDGISEEDTWRLGYLAQACTHLSPRPAPPPPFTSTSRFTNVSTHHQRCLLHKEDSTTKNESTGVTLPWSDEASLSSLGRDHDTGSQVVLLAPPHRHAVYRAHGACVIKDRTTALDHILLSDGTLIRSGEKPTRKEVVEGCKEAAKRLANREENIRQVLQLK